MPDRRADRGRHQARKRAVDLLFEAEAALAAAEKPVTRVPPTPWSPVPTEVEGIAEAIRDMRTLAAAGD